MNESTTFEQMTKLATERYDHLTDGSALYVPYLLAGHHSPNDPASSPAVRIIKNDAGDPYALEHPVNHGLAMLVSEDDATKEARWWVNVDRVTHGRSCVLCLPFWETLGARVSELEAGEMIYAGTTVDSPLGAATLIVDAEDLGN